MQPVDTTNTSLSVLGPRNAVSGNKESKSTISLETVPIVEPLPRYPLSQTVTELLAHIIELLNTQKTMVEASLSKDLNAQANKEIGILFEAAINSSTASSSTKTQAQSAPVVTRTSTTPVSSVANTTQTSLSTSKEQAPLETSTVNTINTSPEPV